ncbi:hypothetical protein ACYRFS_00455 [Listeria kieliensis]|uniref:hypothetical protein n=1 Tax=Listeria kieliensis TaxID=1621700 RepID=UPI001403CA38|nr:hypothetical protein [Listeria kieliensis]
MNKNGFTLLVTLFLLSLTLMTVTTVTLLFERQIMFEKSWQDYYKAKIKKDSSFE